MISQTRFYTELQKTINLCGFMVKKESFEMYYDKIKYFNEEAVFKGIELLIDDPPAKLTLTALKSFIRQTKIGDIQKKWSGVDCDECIEGLVYEKIDGYNYVFRCVKCKSYNVESYPYHTPEEVFNLTSRIDRIKDGDKGEFFINRESYRN
jgi:hypothetical protein